jgi:Tol biopolymer transport system component
MGKVFLANHEALGRKAALKVLPAHFSRNAEWVRRFKREARAAGQINHQNIVIVYEIGETEGRHFIATEYVEGETLREMMGGKPMDARKALEIARQIAAALTAAHAAGVVHRDIKPENVMVRRRDGVVKVLDFGLAKLTEERQGDKGTGGQGEKPLVPSLPLSLSIASGVVMGTVRYMSPEQARGEAVDHRTDLFSLGVVMYEMLNGRAPFPGETIEEARTAILQHKPAFNTSSRWQRILRRALRKSKDARYQTAAEMRDDLGALLKWPVWPTRRAMVSALLAVLASIVGALWKLKNRGATDRPEPKPEIQPVGITGLIVHADVSPDGRRFAISEWKKNRRRLKVWEAATGNSIELLPPGFDRDCLSPTFAPDMRSIYFLAAEEKSSRTSLYQIPANGGSPRKIIDRINSPVAVSPDGRRLAFMRVSDDGAETALMVADENGGALRQLAARRDPLKIASKRPAWSPDGGRIAFAAGTHGIAHDHQVYQVPADGGAEQLLSQLSLRRLDDLVWLGDGSGMGFSGSDPDEIIGRVWHLSFADDRWRELTSDTASALCEYGVSSSTAQGGELFAVRGMTSLSLWVMPAFDSRQARQLTPGGETAGGHGICWTPDGRIVYAGGTNQAQRIRMVDPDGGNDRAVTSDEKDSDGPFITRDGRYMAYCSRRSPGYMNIWRMDRGSGALLQLSFGREDVEPRCSPDGQWVIFVAKAEGQGVSIRRVSIEGGESVLLAADCRANPSPTISPDGKRLAYFRRVPGQEGKRIEVISLAGPRSVSAPPLKIFRLSDSAYFPHWSHDGRSIIYAQAEDRTTNLWELSYENGRRRQLTDFDSDEIAWFALSPDGRQVAFSRVKTIRDVVRISNFL